MNNEEDVIELTQDAYDDLVKELEHRKTTLRQEIAQEISDARDLGDLSENHAYTSAMEKKDLNEDRIIDLESMLKNAKVVQQSNSTNMVMIGTTVEIESVETKRSRTITLVGKEETQSADPREGKISIDSPIGRAVFKAKVGDVVEVDLDERKVLYKIKKIVK